MPSDSREGRKDAAPLLLPWGIGAMERPMAGADVLSLWFGGGLVLLGWTGLALLLTA